MIRTNKQSDASFLRHQLSELAKYEKIREQRIAEQGKQEKEEKKKEEMPDKTKD